MWGTGQDGGGSLVVVIPGRRFEGFGDFVDEAVFFGGFGGQEEVSIGVFGDIFDRFPGVVGEDIVEDFPVSEDFIGLDFDIADLSTDSTVRLVDHDAGIGEGESFTFGTSGEEDGGAAGGLPDTIGGDRAAEDLHDIVDGERGDDVTAGRIEVEVDVFLFVFALEVEQFHNDFVGVSGVDSALQENDSVFKQQVAERHLALALHLLVGIGVQDWRMVVILSSFQVI